jgi:hypothetical protein
MKDPKSLFDTINDLMPAHPDGQVYIEKISKDIEKAVDEYFFYKHLEGIEFSHQQSFVTVDKKHLYIVLEGESNVYKIKLVLNNNIILKAEVLKPF